MAQGPIKFNFDNAFDTGRPRPKPAAPPPPSFSGDDLAAARAAAFAEGETAGRAAQQAETEAALASATAQLAAAVADLGARVTGAERRLKADAAALGHAVARKLCQTLTAGLPMAEMEAMVNDCLTELRDEPRVVVHVAGAVLDQARSHFETAAAAAAFPGRLIVLADDTLGLGDVRVEWAHGGVLRDEKALAAAIESAVNRYVTAQAAGHALRS
ncbi:hypothetical protein [Zavarzinia sp.]|uniref:hypothetical protein n=1 Tax=Zavarzinia sp. TaxID=2027920 RepID=UPI003561E18A